MKTILSSRRHHYVARVSIFLIAVALVAGMVSCDHGKLPLDHFKCYEVDSQTYIGENVTLEDEFGAVNATVEYAVAFGNPAEKLHNDVLTQISNPDHHLTVYNITTESEPRTWQVEVVNQFGTQNLTVSGPVMLAVPTQKVEPGGHNPPVGLDHFLLYKVIQSPGMEVHVGLNDQFGNEPQVWMYQPVFFANPVQKTLGDNVTTIVDPEAHLVFYEIEAGPFQGVVQVMNQFGNQNLYVRNPVLLAVPSDEKFAISRYTLTMAVDPVAGGTATDLINASPYGAGTVVNIKAVAAAGYHFVGWTAPAGVFGNPNAALTPFTMPAQHVTVTANFKFGPQYIPMVAAGFVHTVGLKTNSTVVAVGDNGDGQCNVGNWTGINETAAGYYHTVGLKSDGTVVIVGSCNCDVSSWTGIIKVAAGWFHTVGLKSGGTVVAVGLNLSGQCNVDNWTNIIQVAAGEMHTVGLRSDGTVVAVGANHEGQLNVGNWTNIVQVAAGEDYTVGLKADGTVVAVGENYHGQRDVDGWTNIVQIAAGYAHTVGLENDGTVVAVGWNYYGQRDVNGWTNIVQVAAGVLHTVGLKADGTVVAVGNNDAGQCNVGGWDLN